jgi:hypothetical protein
MIVPIDLKVKHQFISCIKYWNLTMNIGSINNNDEDDNDKLVSSEIISDIR